MTSVTSGVVPGRSVCWTMSDRLHSMRTQSTDVNAGLRGPRFGGAVAPSCPPSTRAAAILDVLATDGGLGPPRPLSSRTWRAELGLPKSSVANICAALLEAGLIRRVGAGFGLGRRLAELGGRLPLDRRPGPGLPRADRSAPGRLRGDRASRRPGRAGRHVPRAARRSPGHSGSRPRSAGDCRRPAPRSARQPWRPCP